MRISLFLVFLTILHSSSALSEFSDGWSSFLDFAKDTGGKAVEFSKEVGKKAEEFAKVAGEKVGEFNLKEASETVVEFAKVAGEKVGEFSLKATSETVVEFAKAAGEKVGEFSLKEASETVVEFANVVGEEVSHLAGVVVHDVDAVAHKTMEEFKASIGDVNLKVQAIRDDLEVHGFSSNRIFDMLSAQLGSAFESLKAEFSVLPPEKQTAEYKDRAVMLARFLDMVEDGFVKVSALSGIPESDVRKSFGIIKAELNRAILITVNQIVNHPGLFINAALLLIPEYWILHQCLGIFGIGLAVSQFLRSITALVQGQFWGGANEEGSWFAVLQSLGAVLIAGGILNSVDLLLIPSLRPLLRILGFGPLGPVKGSLAARAQRQFWAGAIKEGSWFAVLQSTGMRL